MQNDNNYQLMSHTKLFMMESKTLFFLCYPQGQNWAVKQNIDPFDNSNCLRLAEWLSHFVVNEEFASPRSPDLFSSDTRIQNLTLSSQSHEAMKFK